jgi:hypothetical protein
LEYSKRVTGICETHMEALKLQAKTLFELGLLAESRTLAEQLFNRDPDDAQIAALIKSLRNGRTNRRYSPMYRFKELILTEWPKLLVEERLLGKLV